MDKIIYEDKNIIIFNKPSGMLVQSDRSFDVDAVSYLKTYLASRGDTAELSVINRLDRPVGGLVLFAKNPQYAAKISKELTGGGISKEYFAVVCGKPAADEGSYVDYLVKDSRTNTSRIAQKEEKGAKKAELLYKVIKTMTIEEDGEKREVSLVKIQLITGRHHQIRVQFAGRKMPLLGDTKYGTDNEADRRYKGISLCSYRLAFCGQEFAIRPSGGGFEYFKEELETI